MQRKMKPKRLTGLITGTQGPKRDNVKQRCKSDELRIILQHETSETSDKRTRTYFGQGLAIQGSPRRCCWPPSPSGLATDGPKT